MKTFKVVLRLIFFMIIFSTVIQAFDISPLKSRYQFTKQCQKDSKVTQEQILAIRRGEHVDSPEIKKHVLCVAKKAKIIDENGLIDEEVVKSKLRNINDQDEMIEDIVNKCCINKQTPEDTAVDAFQCLHTIEPNFAFT